jgi:DNA polymerase III epsilon subunit family exonuclease
VSLLSGTRLLAMDTETTGFDPAAGHEVIEVACVALDDGVIGEAWASFIAPNRPIPADATRVHGITDADVRGAPAPADVATELERRCAGRTLVFHHAAFDLAFLSALMRGAGRVPLWNPIVDTLGLARGLFEPGGNSLGALATRLGLPAERAHRARGDALTTARLLLALAPRWEAERGVRSVAELAAASQDVLRETMRRPRS